MKIAELREICKKLKVPSLGKKISLIARILYFLETNKVLEEKVIPGISKAKRGAHIPEKEKL